MTSEARMQANRLNAQKSTGPRTPEGKAAVSQNAVTHGLFAQAAVLHQEERDEYARHREGLLRELEPNGVQEMELAERIVSLSWRLGRAAEYQSAAFVALYDQAVAAAAEEAESQPDAGSLCTGDAVLGRMLLADFSGPRVLERMQLYERRIENSLCRVRAQWRELRSQALWAPRKDKAIGGGAREDAAGSRMPGKTEGIGPEGPTHKETPCGVTTNAPRIREPVCETKPPLAQAGDIGQGESEKTNPIAGRERRVPARAVA